MRQRFGGGALALFVLLCASALPPAGATPPASAFDALRAELEARRDGDFAGPLDQAGKRRQKAVLKGIALLDKIALDLDGDLGVGIKTAGTLAKSLAKAYPSEFADGTGPLAGALIGALTTFQSEINVHSLPDLATRINGLIPSPAATKAGKGRDAAAAAFSAPVATMDELARVLLKTWKTIVKANRAADKAEPYPVLPESMSLTVGDLVLQADDGTAPLGEPLSRCEVHAVGHALVVYGTFTDALTGDVHSVRFSAYGVEAPGSFSLMVPVLSTVYRVVHPDLSEDAWNLDSGTMDVGIFNLTRGVIAGHLSGSATGGPGMTTISISVDFTVHGIFESPDGAVP